LAYGVNTMVVVVLCLDFYGKPPLPSDIRHALRSVESGSVHFQPCGFVPGAVARKGPAFSFREVDPWDSHGGIADPNRYIVRDQVHHPRTMQIRESRSKIADTTTGSACQKAGRIATSASRKQAQEAPESTIGLCQAARRLVGQGLTARRRRRSADGQ